MTDLSRQDTTIPGLTYPAARVAAPRIHAHFSAELGEARKRAQAGIGVVHAIAAIEAMIGAAFWASLRREEGYVPKISLAFVSPSETAHPLVFERPLALVSAALTKVAPAVERAGIHLGVWDSGDGLSVWGTTREVPPIGFVLEVAAPGVLVIKHHRGERGKFVNVAVLEGDVVKIVDERASSLPDCPALVGSLLGLEAPGTWTDSVNILVQLAVSMRAHGRGALLLIVPGGTETWMESIVRPIPYAISPPFSELAALAREMPTEMRRRVWQDALARSVEAIAGLTAVDGAAVMTTNYELLAFGAKIARRKGWPQVEQVTVTEPIEQGVAALLDPAQLGGTRHLSAAQFVHDQRDAIALVASQDGRFTIFAWSACEERVHAHRVEILLL
jgi:hypothetical protein